MRGEHGVAWAQQVLEELCRPRLDVHQQMHSEKMYPMTEKQYEIIVLLSGDIHFTYKKTNQYREGSILKVL